MSKRRENLERARPVSGPERDEIRLVSLGVRPPRIAYIISATAVVDELLKFITYNTSIWGGISNCFIPAADGHIREDWLRALYAYDPDVLVAGTTMDANLGSEIYGHVQPHSSWAWADKMLEHHESGVDGLRNVLMHTVTRSTWERLRPEQGSNLLLPPKLVDAPFRLTAAAQFGEVAGLVGGRVHAQAERGDRPP